jgi:hypothetical protein
MPSSISAAASAALMTLFNNEGKRIRSRYMNGYLGLRKQGGQCSDFKKFRPATMVECRVAI